MSKLTFIEVCQHGHTSIRINRDHIILKGKMYRFSKFLLWNTLHIKT